jgi:hypothetical protein
MSEIKCPHCGEVFKVDEQGYAAIVAQVKTAEFDKELDKRVADEKDKALKLAKLDFDSKYTKAVNDKDNHGQGAFHCECRYSLLYLWSAQGEVSYRAGHDRSRR